MVRVYLVGGYVRDMIMGRKSKDIDFTVVAKSYDDMRNHVVSVIGAEIKVEKPEFFTIRAVHSELGGVDYVVARRDGDYSDGRRPESVEIGTLEDEK